MVSAQPYIITQLIPFNPARFDACMSFIVDRLYHRPLTLFESVKLHVMTDVFHVLQHGHQAIGGELQPWPHGPVVEPAYERLKRWQRGFEESGAQPIEYQVFPGEVATFRPTIASDSDDMSPSEIEAIEKAVTLLRPMNFDSAYAFFHNDETYMGRAYNRAKADARPLAWGDIIDAHDQIYGSNLQHLKARLISYP